VVTVCEHRAVTRGWRRAAGAASHAIAVVLTPYQRQVLVALAPNGISIDVLAERLGTNRNALYKTLHDARRKLRGHLAENGLTLDMMEEEL